MSVDLSRRGVFGVAAAAAATAIPAAPPASAAASSEIGAAAELRLSLGLTARDRLDGVVGYVLRRAKDGESPNVWAGFGENEWNGGVLYGKEDIARWAAAENWSCVRAIVQERAELLRQLKAEHVPSRDYDGDFIMVRDDQVVATEEAEDYLFDDARCWAWAAEPEEFSYDPEEALDEHLADWFDEAESWIPEADRLPLRHAWANLIAKHGASLTRYCEDHKRLVVFNESDFTAELAHWAERLALCEAAIARIKAEGPQATHQLYVTDTVERIARAVWREIESRRKWGGA